MKIGGDEDIEESNMMDSHMCLFNYLLIKIQIYKKPFFFFVNVCNELMTSNTFSSIAFASK